MADIHDLLEAMGFAKKFHDMLDGVTANLRQTLTVSGVDIPDELWQEFARDLREDPKIRDMVQTLAAEAYPLDAAEMDQVVAFYKTPSGKRAMEKMAVVHQLVSQASTAHLERIGNALVEKMTRST